MAAPDYVPKPPEDRPRVYTSPPWRPEPWMADRPAELGGPQPLGPRLGTPGPDQGYALKFARKYEGQLVLGPDEREDDALAGCLALAMRRAGMFGRAPIIHDLTVALTLWGYLTEVPPAFQAARRKVFAGVANVHHYMERRAVVDAIPDDALRLAPAEAAELVRATPAEMESFARAIQGTVVVD